MPSTHPTSSSPPSPVAKSSVSVQPHSTNTANTSKKTVLSNVASKPFSLSLQERKTPSLSSKASAIATKLTTVFKSQTLPSNKPSNYPTATSPHVSNPTNLSTSSTKPVLAFASRACPSHQTSLTSKNKSNDSPSKKMKPSKLPTTKKQPNSVTKPNHSAAKRNKSNAIGVPKPRKLMASSTMKSSLKSSPK